MGKSKYQKDYLHSDQERQELLNEFVNEKSESAAQLHISTSRVLQIQKEQAGARLLDKHIGQMEVFYSNFLKRIKRKKKYSECELNAEISNTRLRLERLEEMREKKIYIEKEL